MEYSITSFLKAVAVSLNISIDSFSSASSTVWLPMTSILDRLDYM